MEEKALNTEKAENGFTDRSGVKENACPLSPEMKENAYRHDADDGKSSGEGSADNTVTFDSLAQTKAVLSDNTVAGDTDADSSAVAPEGVSAAGILSEAEKEDKEFLALIKGKYKDAYRRRTEGIIRRRLKSVRPRQATSDTEHPLVEAPGAVRTASDVPASGKAVSGEDITGQAAAFLPSATEKKASEGNNEESVMSKRLAIDTAKATNRSRPRENGVGGSVGTVTGINVSALKGSDVLELLRRAENGEMIKFR